MLAGKDAAQEDGLSFNKRWSTALLLYRCSILQSQHKANCGVRRSDGQ